ncbi:hypothetical protein EUX98_g3316 [Antrodiella citrinella]|uniref:Uncharacterized protein n=1 Tax=Antrodiella citrinella TaxID=2447956 RepID=A0A4S4MWV3_9APHY|nr:hypothetical protein EUX98_g3316 [Antrodiella citrinella]
MLPSASEHNVRLVLLNRRDYPGTVTLSADEFKPFLAASADDDRAIIEACTRD